MPSSIAPQLWTTLEDAARAARERAFAPYSSFKVGAALLTDTGETFVGCNVENATFGATCCAERTAVFAAVAQGHVRFAAMAVATDTEAPTTCCGICRQVLAEFGDLPLSFVTLKGARQTHQLSALLPHAFALRKP